MTSPNGPRVRPATAEDLPAASRTLGLAFAGYPATRHTVDPERHEERVTELQNLLLTRVGMDHGRVWVADGGAAVAVWTTPHNDNAAVGFAGIGARVTALAGSRQAAHEEMEAALWPHRPKEPVWFLATVGVHPDRQGEGLGSAVLEPGLSAAARAEVAAYAETSDERNLAFYQRLGFERDAEVALPGDGPRTWCLTRPPQAGPPQAGPPRTRRSAAPGREHHTP